MKKIFTLLAVAAMALTASAQDNIYKAPGISLEPNTTLVDNDNLTVSTVFQATGGEAKKEICGVEFDGWFQVRVAADPTADNVTGTDNGGSTPLVVVAKKEIEYSIYYRRQKGSNGYDLDDNKDMLIVNQADMQRVADGVLAFDNEAEKEESYAFVKKTVTLAPGTYTVYRRGSTVQVYGFEWKANETTPGALMSWDFTKWSEATVANLKAGSNWSDIEKATSDAPTEKSKDNCFWQVSYEEGKTAEGYLTANDVVIEELKGLVYTNEKTNRSLAIAVNYPDPNPDSDFGPYHGPAYLWLGSKEVNYFVIPGVPAGATIKMGVESHKLSDPRGVELSVAGATLTAPNGSPVDAPTTYTEQEWLVPATAAESNDVQIYNTNGCHIYFITVTADASTSAIKTIVTDENAPVEYFNLQGVRVENPANGLYIKRQGSKVTKVIVK